MKVTLSGTCSECYQATDLVLTEKTREIICPTCGHSVPPLDEGSMASLAKDQSKCTMMGIAAVAAFLVAGLLFLGFISKSGGGVPGAMQSLPGAAMAMMAGSILLLIVSLALGFIASSRSYVCEF
jgi:DNA-directed RNA polymerase subunit RPC12/RpoP